VLVTLRVRHDAPVHSDIGVADVIYQLRGDLYLAAWQGEESGLKFELGPIELEFAVVVDSSRGANAAAKLWVADVGVDGKHSSQVTHRIKLVLNAVDAKTNQPLRLSDQTAEMPPRRG
jgi:hypothetical protein